MFLSTLNQIGYLFLLIALGYALMRLCRFPTDSTKVLSRLESYLFMPALILSNFSENFTVERIKDAWKFFLCGLIIIVISILISFIITRYTAKDAYLRRIHTYCLAFSNFGFMGTAVVNALYPGLFTDYLILATPIWIFNYGWAIPALLIPIDERKSGVRARLKNLLNPMFVGMLIGIIIGLSGIKLPIFIASAVDGLGKCMSPVAMLITGMTVAGINLRKILKDKSIYILTVISIVIIPFAFIGVCKLLPITYEVALCGLCAIAMPLGLNSVVIPAAYGKDTSQAAGMAIVSHLFSALTIPLVITVFTNIM